MYKSSRTPAFAPHSASPRHPFQIKRMLVPKIGCKQCERVQKKIGCNLTHLAISPPPPWILFLNLPLFLDRKHVFFLVQISTSVLQGTIAYRHIDWMDKVSWRGHFEPRKKVQWVPADWWRLSEKRVDQASQAASSSRQTGRTSRPDTAIFKGNAH